MKKHPWPLVPALLVTAVILGLPLLTGPSSHAAPAPASALEIEPLRHKPYSETGVQGVRFEMAAIPGGSYLRGSPAAEKGRAPDEGPRHPVRVSPFWMMTTEVTWDLYDLYRNDGPVATNRENEAALERDADALTRPTPPYPDETRGFGREGYPAVGMSHHAATTFCRWLSAKTGRPYRLPTEAEWEWACRAGTDTAYFFGELPDRLGEYAWYEANAEDSTHPVGKKKPNPWGLFDVCGNVAEWCLDRYDPREYEKHPRDHKTLNPARPPLAERFGHVARGGSWTDPARACRSAARRGSDNSWNKVDPEPGIWWDWDADFVGFRVVRPVDEARDPHKGIVSRVRRVIRN